MHSYRAPSGSTSQQPKRTERSSYFPESTSMSSADDGRSKLDKVESESGSMNDLSDDYSPAHNRYRSIQRQQDDFKLYETFPSTRNVPFWDRTPLGNSVLVRCNDVLPVLQIDSENIYYILRESLDHAESNLINFNFDRSVALRSMMHAISGQNGDTSPSVAIKSNILQSSNPYCFKMISPQAIKVQQSTKSTHNNNNINNNSILSIPFYIRSQSENCFKFDISSSRQLVLNLQRSLATSPSLSPKSCMRIRCMGHSVGHNNNTSLAGTFRFEAILPNISFVNVPIKRLPLLATPLSERLTRNIQSPRKSEPYIGPSSGFLSMSSNRRAIPIADSDSASLARCPVVGVWVFISNSELSEGIGRGASNVRNSIGNFSYNSCSDESTSVVFHPNVWAACSRYVYSEQIQRANQDPNSFLVMIFSESEYSCWEVNPIAAPVSRSSTDTSSSDNELFSKFTFMDFTVDLSCEKVRDGSWASEPVVCKLRVVAKNDYVSAPMLDTYPERVDSMVNKRVTASHSNVNNNKNNDEYKRSGNSSSSSDNNSNSINILTSSSNFVRTSAIESDLSVGSAGEATPQPRSHVPMSYISSIGKSDSSANVHQGVDPIAGELHRNDGSRRSANIRQSGSTENVFRYSSESSISKLINATAKEGNSENSSLDVKGVITHSRNGSPIKSEVDMFPASVVLAQQLEITELRNEVTQLKALVQQLTSAVSSSLSLGNVSTRGPSSLDPVRNSFSNATSVGHGSLSVSTDSIPLVSESNQVESAVSTSSNNFSSLYAYNGNSNGEDNYNNDDDDDNVNGDYNDYDSDGNLSEESGVSDDEAVSKAAESDELLPSHSKSHSLVMDTHVLYGDDSNFSRYVAKLNPLAAQLKDLPKIVVEKVHFQDEVEESGDNENESDISSHQYSGLTGSSVVGQGRIDASSRYEPSNISNSGSNTGKSGSNSNCNWGGRAVADAQRPLTFSSSSLNRPESPSMFAESESILAIEQKYLRK